VNGVLDMGFVYSSAKVLHFTEKIKSLPRDQGAIESPIHIRIKPTNACNHSCQYCAYRTDGLQLGKDMNSRDSIPRQKMREIINDIIEMGVKAVTFSGGGEPLLYPHLLETVRQLSESSVKFAALTNGARLFGELAEMFAHHGTWLRISIDGWDDESYSTYRNMPSGEFSKIMQNIEEFKKLNGKCYLGISLIVDRLNALHVYDFIRSLKNLGVDSVKVSPCIVSNDSAENNLYHQPIFNVVKEQVSRAVDDLSDDEFEIFDAYHQLDEKFRKDYHWCPYIQILPVIGADLNVYSCQDKAYNLDCGLIGSIKDKRFKDFWFTDKVNFFQINPSIHCNHHCVANAKNKLVIDFLNADNPHLPFV
jgi:MoaA/NifB/PqqE/SkfB family radical SAM enzyme